MIRTGPAFAGSPYGVVSGRQASRWLHPEPSVRPSPPDFLPWALPKFEGRQRVTPAPAGCPPFRFTSFRLSCLPASHERKAGAHTPPMGPGFKCGQELRRGRKKQHRESRAKEANARTESRKGRR